MEYRPTGRSGLDDLFAQVGAAHLDGRVRPHFLFNALNMIARLNDAGRPTDANRTVLALATILRYGFETPDELTPLREELRVVEAYATIQQFRFGDKVSLTLAIPPDLIQVPILPRALLRLVEKAFEAIEPKVGPGRVMVSAIAQNGSVMIAVTDDRADGTETVARITIPLA